MLESNINAALTLAGQWITLAQSIVSDATSIFGMVSSLPGNYGRYNGGASSGFLKTIGVSQNSTATVSTLVAAGISSRQAVNTDAQTLLSAISSGVVADMSTAIQVLVADVLAVTIDPADGVRLLTALCNFYPDNSVSPIQTAMGNLCRRAAVISLCRASATYQPSSSTDAYNVRNTITALLDIEIGIAGDNNEDNSFSALRALRQAIIADLNKKGASLPSLSTVTVGVSLPAEVMALRLYGDAGRGDEIAQETNAPHPAFQPITMQVLSS
jgi:prophage DNA circulation protein